ncbi:MAG: FkbM family methyltransferase [Acidimicrobiales bacterium]
MDRYTTKRRLLRPVTAWRRRQAHDESPFNRAVFEAHDYRPAMRRFFDAARNEADILIDVDLPEGAVVLDVGAYEGEWSQRVLGRADVGGPQDLRIHAFEPEPRAIRRLREAMDDRRFELHPFALGGADRVEVITMAGPGSSLFVDPTSASVFGSTQVAMRDVDAVLTSLAIDRLDLVKINIEGGEFELLDRLHHTGWLERTGTIIVQFHEFAPDAYRARRRSRRQLAETHRCAWSYTWVYERWDPR